MDRHVSAICFRFCRLAVQSWSLCLARSARRPLHLAVSYGQSAISWVPKKLSSRRKTPWKLSITRKANARARLKKVDAVIETVRASGIQCKALVSRTPYPLGLVVPAVLFRSRTAPCSCPRNMKWSQKINTPSLARLPVGIGRAFTKCLNGRGYVFLSSRMSAFLTMTT